MRTAFKTLQQHLQLRQDAKLTLHSACLHAYVSGNYRWGAGLLLQSTWHPCAVHTEYIYRVKVYVQSTLQRSAALHINTVLHYRKIHCSTAQQATPQLNRVQLGAAQRSRPMQSTHLSLVTMQPSVYQRLWLLPACPPPLSTLH